MFDKHQPIIGAFARANPDNFARVLQFVILTIRQSLANVPADMETVDQGGDAALSLLFGWKFAAYANIAARAETLYYQCEHEAAHQTGDDLARAVIEIIAGEPGFGLPKAGFVAQLIYGVGGCLDTHNLNRFGLSRHTFEHYRRLKTAKARRARLDRYVDTCRNCGGARELWDSWCEYVADNQPNVYRDALHVSRLHVEAILGDTEHE